jgi:signal transduction histidine kinase
VTARRARDVLLVEVSDDGVGGADPNGSGLAGLRDRVVALGGEFEVTSVRSSGTRIAAAIPLPR